MNGGEGNLPYGLGGTSVQHLNYDEQGLAEG